MDLIQAPPKLPVVRNLNDEVPTRWIVVPIEGIYERHDPVATVAEISEFDGLDAARRKGIWKSDRQRIAQKLPHDGFGHGPSGAAVCACRVGRFLRVRAAKQHKSECKEYHYVKKPLDHLDRSRIALLAAKRL